MNVAILGSSFDPPHKGHLEIARNILKSKKVQKVILIPVYIHPFSKKLTSSTHRLTMTKMLKEKNISISDFEIRKKSTSYSIDTLKYLKRKFPKNNFYWIIGSDNIKDFPKWKNWKKIINEFGLIVIARDAKIDIEKELDKIIQSKNLHKNIIILTSKDFKPLDISSTEIKKRIKLGKSIKNLVPEKVEGYIIKNKLYL